MSDEVQRTKYVRSFEHPCDDFVLNDDKGNEYHPHAGESVRFRADFPWELMRLMNPDDIAGMSGLEYAGRVVRLLQRQIVAWDWTDDAGKHWPSPDDDPEGFADALWWLGDEERNYLRLHCWDSSRLGEA